MPTDGTITRSRWDVLFDNPILRYEGVPRFLRRKRAGGWRVAIMVGLVASTGCGLLLVLSGAEFAAGLGLTLATLWSLVTILAPALQTSRAIARERQRGSWDGIRMSRLRPADIVFGKLLSALLPFWIVGLLLAPFLIITTSLWDFNFVEKPNLLARYLSTFAISVSYASIALWFSLRSKAENSPLFLTLLSIVVIFHLSATTLKWFNVTPPGYAPREGFAARQLPVLASFSVLLLPGALALADLLLRFRKLECLGRK